MSGATVSITVDDAAVRAALAQLVKQLQSPRAALRDVGEALLRSTDEHFRQQRGPDGTPWPALSEVTLERRLDARKGTRGKRGLTKKGRTLLANAKILRDSGALQDTIRYQLTADGHGVAVGTNRVYGAMQQFGGTRAQWPHLWGDIPPRPFLGVSEADRAEIIAIFERHLAP